MCVLWSNVFGVLAWRGVARAARFPPHSSCRIGSPPPHKLDPNTQIKLEPCLQGRGREGTVGVVVNKREKGFDSICILLDSICARSVVFFFFSCFLVFRLLPSRREGVTWRSRRPMRRFGVNRGQQTPLDSERDELRAAASVYA